MTYRVTYRVCSRNHWRQTLRRGQSLQIAMKGPLSNGLCIRASRIRGAVSMVCRAPSKPRLHSGHGTWSGARMMNAKHNKCERMKSKLPHYGKLLLKDLLASGKNRVPTASKIIVNVSSISCGGRGSVWRTATVLMHVNDRSYQSKRGQAMPLRLIPGQKGATDVEWGADHRNGPCSSGR